MQKEIFEQPESIMNTMRGRVKFQDYQGLCWYRPVTGLCNHFDIDSYLSAP